MSIGSGVLLPRVVEIPPFPILRPLAYTTGLGYRPTCDMGSGPHTTDFYENWQGKGTHDVIILSNFGFNTFRGFRSTGGQNLHFSKDSGGDRYNSAATTAQPVMVKLGSSKIEVD